MPLNAIATLRQDYEKAQQALTQLLDTLKTYDANFTLTQRVEPIQFSQIRELVDEETVLMEWYLTRERIYTFVVFGGEPPQPDGVAKGGLFSCLLSIENPPSLIKDRDGSDKSLAALPAADIESEMISRLFPASTRLAETAATTLGVKTALQQSHTVMHFTGHGYYEFADPVASALCLTGCDILTVQDIISLNLSSYHLIYLSACETAVSGNPTITSEYVGLTSGFLGSGVGSVLSTLWQVQSDASTLFALYFYQQLQQGHPYPVAVTATQKWLKSVTKENLSLWYQQQIQQLEKQPELSAGDIRCLNYFEGCYNEVATIKENPPFSHPYHWSPFTLYGL